MRDNQLIVDDDNDDGEIPKAREDTLVSLSISSLATSDLASTISFYGASRSAVKPRWGEGEL